MHESASLPELPVIMPQKRTPRAGAHLKNGSGINYSSFSTNRMFFKNNFAEYDKTSILIPVIPHHHRTLGGLLG
jgi:hypothetical protein